MSSLEERFATSQEQVNSLSSRPDNETLLKLYAFYKQATEGDIKGERPGGFDFKGAAKYDAWAALKGVDEETAMQSYIKLVDELLAKE